jgi:hypothetical protein
MRILSKNSALFLLLVLLPFCAVGAYDLPDHYQADEVVHFAVEREGKVVGTQEATCLGWQVIDAESLYVFKMNSTTSLQQLGKSYNLDVLSVAAYKPDGLPRNYYYEMSPLGRKITQQGFFTGRDYYGTNNRFGNEQSFSIPTPSWPLLLDTHFGLEWEIAAAAFDVEVGDSITLQAMVPQANRLVELHVTRLGDQSVTYDGRQVTTHVYSVAPANQLFYVDDQGRLLKAYDTAQRTSVLRLPPGETAEIATTPVIDTLFKRAPWYALLLLFGLTWMIALGWKESARWQVLLLLLIGALIFYPELKLMMWVTLLYEKFLASPMAPRTGSYFALFGLALLFALGEEFAKFLPLWLRSMLAKTTTPRLAIALGAACGAGFAFVQGAYLTAFAPNGSMLLPLDLWERFFVIGVNAGTGALFGLLLISNKPPLFYLIPVGIKTLLGWLFGFAQKGVYGLGVYALLAAIICAGTLVFLYILHADVAKQHAPRRRRRK